jgi:CheY-like chemotaxis protein
MVTMNKLLSGRRVLIVEDEILILMMIEGMLADLGCKSVSAATRNEQAIVLIEGQVFDVAMLDMNLNGKSSGDVADALAARGVPFVYSTGNNVHDTRGAFRDRPVLKKPFSEEQLTKVLSGLLTL